MNDTTLPKARVALAGVLAVAVLLAFDIYAEALVPDGSLRLALATMACNATAAATLTLLFGLAGQLSLGHAGFLLLGAYGAAITASHLHGALGGGAADLSRSFVVVPVAVLVGATLAAGAGWLVGLPSLRLRGDYLAVVTLAFAEVVRLLVATARLDAPGSLDEAWARRSTHGLVDALGSVVAAALRALGGQNGYAGPSGAGLPLYAGPFWVLGGAAVVLAATWKLKASPFGRALRALRDDELAAAAVGLKASRLKLTAFVLSAAGAGVAGALLALARDGSPVVQPESFGFGASFDLVVMVVLGGAGSVTGAAVGAVVLTVLARGLELVQGLPDVRDFAAAHPGVDLDALRLLFFAAVLLVVMVRAPQGLFGEGELRWRRGRGPREVTV